MNGVGFFQIMIMCVGSIITIFWIILYVKYHDCYNHLIKPLKKNEIFMKDILFIGFSITDLIKFDFNSEKSIKRKKKFMQINGRNYASYYCYVYTGAIFTYLITFTPFVLFAAALANDTFILIFGLIALFTLIWYFEFDIDLKVAKRKEALIRTFPNAVSKLTLLVNSGMTMRNAWKIVSEDEGELYREMRITEESIENATSEVIAYKEFGERCDIKEIRKFVSILVQNLQKGNKEVSFLLKQTAAESWQRKKYIVKIKSEIAGSKLMIPIGIMLIAVMIMIIVPVFSSF